MRSLKSPIAASIQPWGERRAATGRDAGEESARRRGLSGDIIPRVPAAARAAIFA